MRFLNEGIAGGEVEMGKRVILSPYGSFLVKSKAERHFLENASVNGLEDYIAAMERKADFARGLLRRKKQKEENMVVWG